MTSSFLDYPMREWFEQHRRMVDGLRLHEIALQQQKMLEGVRNLQRMEEQARRIGEQFRNLHIQQLTFPNITEQLRVSRVQEQVLRDAMAIRETFAHGLGAMAAFEANARQMAELVNSVASPWFGTIDSSSMSVLQGLAGRVATRLEHRADSGGEVALDEIVSLSSDELKHVSKEERWRIDPWQLLIVILTLYFGFSAKADSRSASADFRAAAEKAEAGQQAEIDALERVSESLSDWLRMTIASSHLSAGVAGTHEVTRRRHLREGAAATARSLMVLEPGTEVHLVMHSGSWVAVAIEIEGAPMVGWMDGRYLKELP